MYLTFIEGLRPRALRPAPEPFRSQVGLVVDPQSPYTAKQGQYLAFIYYYTKVNGRAPAEADMQHYFETTPPTVHQMVLSLERKGLLSRTPGSPRSVRVLLDRSQLPDLE
jgi:repressor LexA